MRSRSVDLYVQRIVVYVMGLALLSMPMGTTAIHSLALAAPSTVAPCTLVTETEVEQVIGKLKGAPKSDKSGEAAWCNYQFVGDNAFEIWVLPAGGIDLARKQAKKQTAVKGFGDDAFLTRGMHGLDYVDLFVKKSAVTVKFSLRETSGDEDKLKMLAQKALSRF